MGSLEKAIRDRCYFDGKHLLDVVQGLDNTVDLAKAKNEK